MTREQKFDHWQHHARQWSYVRPPLRPCAEDDAIVAGAVDEWVERTGRRDSTALVLGVTPELCRTRIGANGRVVALDNTFAMIQDGGGSRSMERKSTLHSPTAPLRSSRFPRATPTSSESCAGYLPMTAVASCVASPSPIGVNRWRMSLPSS
jgi:hypothetical protein